MTVAIDHDRSKRSFRRVRFDDVRLSSILVP